MSVEQGYSEGNTMVGTDPAEEARTDYELMLVDRYYGNVVASKVDFAVPNLERDIVVVRQGRIKTNPEPRMAVYAGSLRDAMSADELVKITSERVFFTLEELQQLSTLVHDGRIVRDTRDLLAANYGSENLRNALGKRVEEMLPSLGQLLKCLNAELTVEEFLELLGRKWDV